jgi:hypothetical protein
MKMFQFIKYEEVTGEKHIGLATIKCNYKFLTKNIRDIKDLNELQDCLMDATEYKTFKISNGKNGGYYPNMPSYKKGEEYKEYCITDSNFSKQEMKDEIMQGIHDYLGKPQTLMQQSIFTAPPTYAPKNDTDDIPF